MALHCNPCLYKLVKLLRISFISKPLLTLTFAFSRPIHKFALLTRRENRKLPLKVSAPAKSKNFFKSCSLKLATLLKKTLAQVISFEFCEISKNTFFYRNAQDICSNLYIWFVWSASAVWLCMTISWYIMW